MQGIRPFNKSSVIPLGNYDYMDGDVEIISNESFISMKKQQDIDESKTEIEELQEQIRALEENKVQKEQETKAEVEEMYTKAKEEAQSMIDQAEQAAFDRTQKNMKEKEDLFGQTQLEISSLKSKTEKEQKAFLEQAKSEAVALRDEAYTKGYNEGREIAYEKYMQGLDDLMDKMYRMVNEIRKEKDFVLFKSEDNIIHLLLTMIKKIVKKISAETEGVVVQNALSALDLVSNAFNIQISVNPEDLKILKTHKKELLKRIEKKAELKFFEDPNVDIGGIFIHTEVGDIDATIRSQIEELIDQVDLLNPIKHFANAPENNDEFGKVIDKFGTTYAYRERYGTIKQKEKIAKFEKLQEEQKKAPDMAFDPLFLDNQEKPVVSNEEAISSENQSTGETNLPENSNNNE